MKRKNQNEEDFEYGMEANGRQFIIIDGVKVYVDIMVAETFLINPDPDVYTEVEHIDGNMFNNAADNLRWIKKQ